MKRLIYLSMTALMLLAVSCEKENKPQNNEPVNPLPTTVWTASWTAPSDIQYPVKAFLAFESTSVSLIIAPKMEVGGTPVVMYGKAPYTFEYPSETDPAGNVSFTVSTRSSTVFMLPELTFSGTFNPESDVLTLKVSSTDNNSMFKDALDFVKN